MIFFCKRFYWIFFSKSLVLQIESTKRDSRLHDVQCGPSRIAKVTLADLNETHDGAFVDLANMPGMSFNVYKRIQVKALQTAFERNFRAILYTQSLGRECVSGMTIKDVEIIYDQETREIN